MKTIAIVAATGHGKTWTLGAIQDKALAEGKQIFTVDPGVIRSSDASKPGPLLNRSLINIERSMAAVNADDRRPTVLILDEVPESQLGALKRLIEQRLPTLDYLVVAVAE